MLRLLGQGGMAAVYLARERALKRLVAIKILDPELATSPVFRARFQLEAETAAQLQHPNIVPIYRVGQTGGLTYFTMGYVEGESLADLMKASGRLPLADALRIGREVAAALGSAHRRGIVHRDVKPQNVLIERETGRAMVTDFGIARVVAAEPASHDGDQLTGIGMVMGTPRYMSPEQASGARDLGPASDLYSLGVILYEAIAGAYPYRFGSTTNYMVAHVAQSPIPLVARVGDVPREVEATVHRLLAKDPDDRFDTAEQVAAALAAGHTAEIRQLAQPRRASMPGQIRSRVALVLAVLALAIGGIALAMSRSGGLPDGVDPRRSILVGFFANTRQDPALDWLRVGGVELLAQSLGRWEDLQVVDAERLLDLARRAELSDGAQLSQGDVIGLARQAGVWTATTGVVVPRGTDSVALTVKVYDVAAERLLATASAVAPADADLSPAFKSLADQILRVAGVPRGSVADVEPPTRSIEAYRAYVEGIEARSRWELDRAQDAFARAIASDSSFALAIYELSQVKFGADFLSASDSFVVLADRAFRLAAARPPRERLLLTGYHQFVHARFAEAKQTYRELLARDSTIADAWAGLAAAEQYDLTLVRDARGRERLPASYTTALSAYRRALALDGSDHRLYANLASILAQVALDDDNYRIPAFAEPPPGDVRTFGYRRPKSWFVPLLIDSTIALVPADSLTARYRPATVDSLRAAASGQALEVVRQWLGIAPDEGVAHLLLVNLHRAEGRYDEALVSLREAERLKAATPIPFVIYRLWLLLDAGRLQQAADLADSVASVPALSDSLARDAAIVTQALANALMLGGRPGEAEQLVRARARAMGTRGIPASIQRYYDLSLAGFPLAVSSGAGTVSRADLVRAMAEMSRVIAAAPDSERTSLDEAMAAQVLTAAATLGDTALVRTWMARRSGPVRAGYGAWAAAVSGDGPTAQRLLAIAIRDTARTPRHVWSMARAAELLGRQGDAVRLYAELDTLRYATLETVSADWLFRVRAQAALGALLSDVGDTAGARRAYKRVLGLWRKADPILQPEREAVQRALTELDRTDRGDAAP